MNNPDGVRFVIMAQPRTGSTWLHMLLSSHPGVQVFGELFNPSEEKRRQDARSGQRPMLELTCSPMQYLEANVFKGLKSGQAAGFTLFYDHARKEEWSSLRAYLRQTRVRIIHLRRRNRLERYLSFQLASRSNIWIHQQKRTLSYEPITLPPDQCFQDFHRSEWFEREAQEFFQPNPRLELVYEDLMTDLERQIRSVCDFLKLELHPLTSPTKKQIREDPSRLILNYRQLKQVLQNGVAAARPWARPEWMSFFGG